MVRKFKIYCAKLPNGEMQFHSIISYVNGVREFGHRFIECPVLRTVKVVARDYDGRRTYMTEDYSMRTSEVARWIDLLVDHYISSQCEKSGGETLSVCCPVQ